MAAGSHPRDHSWCKKGQHQLKTQTLTSSLDVSNECKGAFNPIQHNNPEINLIWAKPIAISSVCVCQRHRNEDSTLWSFWETGVTFSHLTTLVLTAEAWIVLGKLKPRGVFYISVRKWFSQWSWAGNVWFAWRQDHKQHCRSNELKLTWTLIIINHPLSPLT